MKKIILMFVFVTVAMLASNVFAQTAPPDGSGSHDVVVKVPNDVTVQVLGAGKDEVVEVPFVVQRIHEVDPAHVTVQKGSNLHLRGGVSLGFDYSAHAGSSYTAGLIGEGGYSDSPWVLEVTSRAGKCEEGVAVDMGMAAMVKAVSHLRLGVGADMKYCADVSDHPEETVDERIVGGSFRTQFEVEHIVVSAWIGIGAVTYPVPGDRKTVVDSYGGLSISLLF